MDISIDKWNRLSGKEQDRLLDKLNQAKYHGPLYEGEMELSNRKMKRITKQIQDYINKGPSND